jgi:hypothetical protein
MKQKMARSTGTDDTVAGRVSQAILDVVARIPDSKERKSRQPTERARSVANDAAINAARWAGALALPPGALGWLTILPDLIKIWDIQTQMVADIAAVYGKTRALTQEQMLYCLFRHMGAQVFRDVVIRVGDRFLFRRASLRMMQRVAQKVGLRVTQRTIGKGVGRMIPIFGALGVAAYAYYDTAKVAATAIELYEGEIELEPDKSAAAGAT